MLVFMATMTAVTQASEITGKLSTGGVSPATPTGLTTSTPGHGDTKITVSWNPVAFVGGYNLYRIKDGTPATLVTSTTNINYSDMGLSDGNYSYQIESYLGTLVSGKSAPTSPVTIDTTVIAPAAPSSASGGGGYTPPATPATTPPTEPYDFNSDGNIDVFDFNILMTHWGTTSGATKVTGDADGNGTVDIYDFNLLIINWQS